MNGKQFAPVVFSLLILACSASSSSRDQSWDDYDATAPDDDSSVGGSGAESGNGGEAGAGGAGGAGASAGTGGVGTGGLAAGGSGVGGSIGGQGPGGSGGSTPPVGPPMSTNVRVIVEPSDDGAALLSAVKAAKKSIHMVMYLLSSTDMENALVSAHQKGIDVKVVLNKTFPGGAGTNSASYTKLHNAGVSVVWAPSGFTYTHEKCVILDAAEAWIMTMNSTLTSASANREYLAVDDDPEDVAEAEALFHGDFTNAAYQPKGKLLVAPVNARTALLQFIATAHSTIDIEGEEFSDYQIAPAVAQMAGQGVKVRVVVATGTTPPQSQTTAIATVKQAGAKVVGTDQPYIHAKTLVVDGTKAYVGSANFSGGSLGYNRELGVLIDNAPEVAKINNAINTDFANGTPQ